MPIQRLRMARLSMLTRGLPYGNDIINVVRKCIVRSTVDYRGASVDPGIYTYMWLDTCLC